MNTFEGQRIYTGSNGLGLFIPIATMSATGRAVYDYLSAGCETCAHFWQPTDQR